MENSFGFVQRYPWKSTKTNILYKYLILLFSKDLVTVEIDSFLAQHWRERERKREGGRGRETLVIITMKVGKCCKVDSKRG